MPPAPRHCTQRPRPSEGEPRPEAGGRVLLLIELGRWEFRLQRHTESTPEPMDREHLPQPMTVYTPEYVGFMPAAREDVE